MLVRTLQTIIEKRLLKAKPSWYLAPVSLEIYLVETLLTGKDHLYLNGDDADVRKILTNTTGTKLKAKN